MKRDPREGPNKIEQLAHDLFKQIINKQKIALYTSVSPVELKAICKEAGYLFHRKIKNKPNQVMAFLSNYHKIMSNCDMRTYEKIINDISLHFLLLASYTLIQNGEIKSAKNLLKKSLGYLQATDPDPILQTTALNNYCLLQIKSGKYYKAINILLSAIKIMEGHMRKLKNEKKKSQAIEDSVFLVNSYFLLSKALQNIMESNHKSEYRELFHQSSQTGLKKAIKYLGKQSLLTKQFFKIADLEEDLKFPIFYQDDQQQRSTMQQRLMKVLNRIEQFVHQQPKQPVVVRQIIQYVAPPPPPPITPPPPAPPKEIFIRKQTQALICQRTRKIGDWHVEVQILKQYEEKLGSVLFNCLRDKDGVKDLINYIIGEERMLKLLTQMNVADILPEQCSLQNLAPHEFIDYCIFSFLNISDNKNIEIFPRAISIIDPFTVHFFKKQQIVFMYHIRANNFRLAFGPKLQSETYYLELELQQQFIESVLKINPEVQKRMQKVYGVLMASQGRENTLKCKQFSQIGVKNQKLIKATISSIFKKLQIFVENHLSDGIDFSKQESQFFKFHQSKNYEHGKFYFIRYLHNIKGFDVYIQNSFETYKPDGKIKAKGNSLYNSTNFFKDFGVSSQSVFSRFRSICQILCLKYNLKYYDIQLTTKDIQAYQQNSISEVKLTLKTFLRKMRIHKKTIVPITACVMSVNNEIPVGIRLSCYNPSSCIQSGYFIQVPFYSWKWPSKIEEQPTDYVNNVVEQYGYKREFFLVDWLQRFGFREIIELAQIDKEDNFYLKGLTSSFYRLDSILDLIE